MRQAYLAGPYTSATEEGIRAHIRSALGYAHALTQVGWHVIVPHTMGPHDATWDEAMERCVALIRRLDPKTDVLLVTLPGWQGSRGAREEVALARAIGLPVLTTCEAMDMPRSSRVLPGGVPPAGNSDPGGMGV